MKCTAVTASHRTRKAFVIGFRRVDRNVKLKLITRKFRKTYLKMHQSGLVLTVLIIISSKSPTFVGGVSFLERSLEILGKLRVCYGDIFIHVPFPTAIDPSQGFDYESGGDWSRSEFAYSETQFKFGTRNSSTLSSSSASPNCWIIMTTVDTENVGSLIGLIAQISTSLKSLTFRQSQPAIVFIHPLSGMTESIQFQLQEHLFQNASFSLNTNVFTLFVSQVDFSLWEVYNIKRLMRIDKILDGRVDSLSRLRHVKSPAGRRGNFHGQSFTAVIRTNQPDWMRYTGSEKDKNITLVGGFSVQLYWNFETMLNFRAKVVTGEGLKTLPNKTIGGTTAVHLNSGTGDIALSMSSVVPFRATHLTFLQPTYYGIINCFFMQPTANSIRDIVTAPFHRFVWFSLIGTWLTLILIVKISSSLKRYSYPRTRNLSLDEKSESPQDGEKISKILDFGWEFGTDYPYFKDEEYTERRELKTPLDTDEQSDLDNDAAFADEIGMWAFTANCQKSCHLVPDSIPMRMMFLIGILCGVVSYVGYSGAITSTLTVSIVPVKQFSDLTKFKFLFTVHELSEPFQNFLQLMIDTQNLKQKVLKISTVEEVSHMLDPKKPMAFLTYNDLFFPTALDLNYTEIFICSSLSYVPVSPVLYKSALFVKKGSEYTEILNLKIIILKERGFNHRYIKTYETSNIFPCGEKTGTVNPIEITDVFTAFLVVCVGLILSAILLTTEILHKKIRLRFLVQ